MKKLNKTEQAVLKYIDSYINKHGYAPSYDEIGNSIGKCKSVVYQAMKVLMTNGEIESDYEDTWHVPRAYRLKRKPQKIYVVITDEYEDVYGAEYHLRGVFTDRKKAERVAGDRGSVAEAEINGKCNVYVGGYIE